MQLNNNRPVNIIVTIGDVTHETIVFTHGDMDKLFSAIREATGLSRDHVIPNDLYISVHRLETGTYSGGMQ